ncbi:response regulator transcription factor [Nocardioides sp. HDW12B]|uniref:response regulator transcription factor n=1 Tax=Nocardioides sp. HDW12B TaxID=2714939 RepID=UPI00140955BF|nr:response regulator transcription factor [Nocardioides sp. HDW12B]QIK67255.1 response regulator transcription factor [Nocardioides sp. HDW12B]
MAPQLLVVEDDDGIAAPLQRTLEREGYVVERVATGQAGLDRVARGGIDLVVLDLGLPDLDGLEVCRRMRADGYQDALMILTARGGELDRVVGLDVGADDYLAKPFALAELLARTRALLRRFTRAASVEVEGGADTGSAGGAGGVGGAAVAPSGAGASETPVAPGVPSGGVGDTAGTGAFRVDVQARRVWVGDTEVVLTSKEFDVLALLDSERGAVLTRERLMDEVWDENWFGSTKTLDVTVGRLRQKLDDNDVPAQVVTVRGVGFRLEVGPRDA